MFIVTSKKWVVFLKLSKFEKKKNVNIHLQEKKGVKKVTFLGE